jgi:hypothetical protein
MASRFTHVFSTPNLRADGFKERDCELSRSHSATSIGLPIASPLSPLRLPSLTSHNQDGIPWSEVMHKSLRLSQFPVPPRHHGPETSETIASLKPHDSNPELQRTGTNKPSDQFPDQIDVVPARAVEIRIQQPTSIATPRASTSVRGGFRENAHPQQAHTIEQVEDESEEGNARHSVHLYSMRISHHLRSGSLLSWDRLADAPDLPTPPRLLRERTVSNQSRYSHVQTQLPRHDRQTSSSGFASSKIPIRWGKVLPNDRDLRGDVASSIYSSRPQSPPDSFGGSMVNVSHHPTSSRQSLELKTRRRSSSFPTDNEDTPRPVQQYGVSNETAAQRSLTTSALLEGSYPLARMNSVAETKKSKFREDFSPSPPRKRVMASSSIMQFLNPKRLSLRSLSEANIQADTHPTSALDGPFDTLPIPADRERRQSRSMISLQVEKEVLSMGKGKGTNHVWDTALKAHQEERAAMFLPQNRDLAVHASLFRERSGSSATRRPSFVEDVDPPAEASTTSTGFSAAILAPLAPNHQALEYPLALLSRRSATVGRDGLSAEQEVTAVFEKQGDSVAVVGAWGRYPSHTRPERTLSASKGDRVETRDFALEAAVRFASARDKEFHEDLIDPTERIPSLPLLPGAKKRKRKVGSGKMPKSHSMTFGRKLIKNYYSGMFKSSSTEFRRHGRGHRSSIASGGTLEHPELEIIPDVFPSGATDGADDHQQKRTDRQVVRRHSERHIPSNSKNTLPTGNSVATLRPRRNSSAPNLKDLADFHDGADDSEHVQDRARAWSVYYETCVPSFPCLSTEGEFGLADFSGPSRMSNDGKRVSMHSHTMPMRMPKHARHVSHFSNMSRRSGRNDCLSMGNEEEDGASEGRSLVSVRRSTMDLISKFKEQETFEHERVMLFTRDGSSGEGAGVGAI